MSNDKISVTRKRLQLVRETSRIYLADKDKSDPDVVLLRRQIAEDIRYFHQKWLNAKQQ